MRFSSPFSLVLFLLVFKRAKKWAHDPKLEKYGQNQVLGIKKCGLVSPPRIKDGFLGVFWKLHP